MESVYFRKLPVGDEIIRGQRKKKPLRSRNRRCIFPRDNTSITDGVPVGPLNDNGTQSSVTFMYIQYYSKTPCRAKIIKFIVFCVYTEEKFSKKKPS